jgi:hypothetical protein
MERVIRQRLPSENLVVRPNFVDFLERIEEFDELYDYQIFEFTRGFGEPRFELVLDRQHLSTEILACLDLYGTENRSLPVSW